MAEVLRHRSSHVAQTTYDQEAQALTVEFTDGQTYQYSDVPPGVYTAFVSSPSVGRAFNAMIRDSFDGEEV